MYPPLEAAWAKYNRAARDLGTLTSNEHVFFGRQPYRVDVAYDGQTDWHIARTRIIEEPPPVFGVLVGSAAHQAYSALNHVTYALAVQHLGAAEAEKRRRAIAFPITSNRAAFERNRVRSMLDPKPWEVIERLQPYHRASRSDGLIEHPLLWLKEIADADKHRVLPSHYGVMYLRDVLAGRSLRWNEAVASGPSFERLVPYQPGGFGDLADGEPLARIRFEVGNADASVTIDPQPKTEIVFESDTWAGLPLRSVGDCLATADRCITELARFFPGESWPPTSHDPVSPYRW
jgi:hypothetical protein